jgi:hypothetical protein
MFWMHQSDFCNRHDEHCDDGVCPRCAEEFNRRMETPPPAKPPEPKQQWDEPYRCHDCQALIGFDGYCSPCLAGLLGE